MNKLFLYSILFIMIITIIISCLYSSAVQDYSVYNISEEDIYISSKGYAWPIPGFYTISSYFGYRSKPTSYASSYHSGLDLPASEGTYFIAVISGTISYTGFNGSGGYTIILQNDNLKVTYCHVSPSYIVNVRRLCRTSPSNWASWTISCL